jgi:small conductance mechanosensitive channel
MAGLSFSLLTCFLKALFFFTKQVHNMFRLLQINADKWFNELRSAGMSFAPKLISALLVLVIGLWVIKLISKLIGRIMSARHYDASLQTFLLSFFKVTMNILLIITVASMMGVNTTSFAALIAGAGIAIGAALNGSLGNFAGGVMMLVFKPFKIGDLIEAQGVTGNVAEMGIFNTVMLTPDHKTVIMPNGPLSTGIITNYTTAGYLRVDLEFAIAPEIDIEKARRVSTEAMQSHSKVLKEPVPEVAVLKVGDGMVKLAVRPYCLQADYWDVYFNVQELVKNAWDKNGIEGPIPHRVIITKQA